MTSLSSPRDPSKGLEGIRAALVAGNPELYRHVALYLQVLRGVLLKQADQACFHLATQVHPQRYLKLSGPRRHALHHLLRERVQTCCSLLTVEQLVCLARQMHREKRQQGDRRQRDLLQRLARSSDGGEAPTAADPAAEPAPPGSVHLGLTPPLDPLTLNWPEGFGLGALLADQQPPGSRPSQHLSSAGEAQADGPGGPADPTLFPPGLDATDATDATEADGDPSSTFSDDQSIAAGLMAALMQDLIEGQGPGEALLDPDGILPMAAVVIPSDMAGDLAEAISEMAGLQRSGEASEPAAGRTLQAAEPPRPAEAPTPWDQPMIPTDPVQVLHWLEGMELALGRRLRILSQAINIDLLRLGLSRGLLPVSLLEAALHGQIDTQSAPPNVVQLQLPFGLQPGAPPLQAAAILLRPIDLEMEEPRLRTCRRRIHQHRQQVSKMAQTYRRLQRRLKAHEAERLWLEDIQSSRSSGS